MIAVGNPYIPVMRSLWTLAGGLLLVLGACTPNPAEADYQKFFDCSDEEGVSSEETVDGYWVNGCGGRLSYYCAGNHCESPVVVLTKRHSRQFGCSRESVHVNRLDGEAWQVEGCDETLTYHCLPPELVGADHDHYRQSKLRKMRCIAETVEN